MCTRWSGKTGLYYTEYLYTQSSGHQLGDVYESWMVLYKAYNFI